jgi:hypothetical protein
LRLTRKEEEEEKNDNSWAKEMIPAAFCFGMSAYRCVVVSCGQRCDLFFFSLPGSVFV